MRWLSTKLYRTLWQMHTQEKPLIRIIGYALTVFIGMALFGYTVYRATHLSFTHDECETFKQYIYPGASFSDIIGMKVPTANNHILNTLLMSACYHTLGNAEWMLRLPNLAGHLLFMVFTALWLARFKNTLFLVLGFVIINANPYLLDFFGLARGYGLALGFMVASIYFFSRYLQQPSLGKMLWCLAVCVLAMISNIALMYYTMGLCFALNVVFIIHLSKTTKKTKPFIIGWIKLNLPIVLMLALCFLFFHDPVKRMVEHHAFYYGGSHFWEDTLGSLVNSCLYTPDKAWPYYMIVYIVVGLVAVGSGLVLNDLLTGKVSTVMYPLLLVAVPSLATVLMHSLLGMNLLIFRVAIFLLVLFLMYVLALLRYGFQFPKGPLIANALLWVFAGLFVYSFYLYANITHTQEWIYDANDRDAINAIVKDVSLHHYQDKVVKVGITWFVEPAMNYYRVTKNCYWLQGFTRDGVATGQYDYYYVSKESLKELPKIPLRLMAYYPISGYSLFAKE